MAISDTGITSVELINTFEQWRSKTNQIITVLNEQSDDDPVTSLLSADSDGGLTINTLSADIVTGASVTGSELTFTGGTIDFTGATTEDIGTVEKFALVEGAGATTTGASPDSKIERAQINECEINLNGQTLRANGASSIVLTGATVSDLGTVELVTINGGTINDANVNITDDNGTRFITVSSAGPHIFTGASFNNGTYNTPTTIGGFTHSANISVNTASALVANIGPIFGTDVGIANVAIGNFPEYTTTPISATSSKGRLHIRTDFAAGSTTATTVEGVADELVLEGNTAVGMTLLANNVSNSIIAFGDNDNTDVGSLIYDHSTDSMHVTTDGANTVVFGNEYGGYMQIVGGDTIGTQAGKLHVNVGSSDATAGMWIDLNDADQQGIRIDANSHVVGVGMSANVFEIRANTNSGHVMTLVHGLGTGTSHDMSGSMLAVTDNNSSTIARAVVDINQDGGGASGSIGLKVKTDGGIGISVVQNADKTGLLVSAAGSVSAGTKVVQFANSTADIFSSFANGTLSCEGSFLTTKHPSTPVFLLGVRDIAGSIVNTN
jgi:hypothetical protein